MNCHISGKEAHLRKKKTRLEEKKGYSGGHSASPKTAYADVSAKKMERLLQNNRRLRAKKSCTP